MGEGAFVAALCFIVVSTGASFVMNIVVVGSGVVGEATGRGFLRKGHVVTFVDINSDTRDRLTAQGLDARVLAAVDLSTIDVVMLAVSTPTVAGHIVLTHLEDAARALGEHMQAIPVAQATKIVVVVRSTVLPGTTERRIKPIVEMASGKVAGTDFGLAMNPEFLRQVSAVQDFDRPWITLLYAHSKRFTCRLVR
jgi:UDPglucose 6-dehydrogenase